MQKHLLTCVATMIMVGLHLGGSSHAAVSREVLDSISTPDEVETSIGTLEFFDGAPLPETADTVYDYLDRMRGVDAFLKGMPAASLLMLMKGIESIGADAANKVVIFDKLMDAKSLYLTATPRRCTCFRTLT